VVAVAENIGLLSSFNVYIPTQTLRALYQLNDDTTGVIYAYLNDVKQAPKVEAELRTGLAAKGYQLLDADAKPFFQKFEVVNREDWTGQKLDVTTWDEELGFLNWIIGMVDFPSILLIIVLAIIVVAGIMNTMWIAIRERTREIGTLRAIGMQRGRVMRMFLTEALLLGAISTSLGSLLAVGVGGLVNSLHLKVPSAGRMLLMQEYLSLSIHPTTVFFSAAMIVLATAVAALYPSLRASQLQPVTAMGHVG
jgi:ABC-type lipoprotein release transport system permease subunit